MFHRQVGKHLITMFCRVASLTHDGYDEHLRCRDRVGRSVDEAFLNTSPSIRVARPG